MSAPDRARIMDDDGTSVHEDADGADVAPPSQWVQTDLDAASAFRQRAAVLAKLARLQQTYDAERAHLDDWLRVETQPLRVDLAKLEANLETYARSTLSSTEASRSYPHGKLTSKWVNASWSITDSGLFLKSFPELTRTPPPPKVEPAKADANKRFKLVADEDGNVLEMVDGETGKKVDPFSVGIEVAAGYRQVKIEGGS